MGLKLLHSADWHLDSLFGSFPEHQRQQLAKEQAQLPDRIADLCIREGCDLVLLSGDLLDGAASRETLERLKQALARCAVPVLISPGNHDFCCPGSPWLEEAWPENVCIFTGGLESLALPGLNCRVWGAGFRSMDCESILEGFRAEGEEQYKLAVLHGDPVQPNSPCNPVTAAQVRSSGLHYLALGHIHKAGSFTAGATLCGWPGCPMGRGWDETGEKGAYLVTLEPEGTRVTPVSLGAPRLYDLTVDIRNDPRHALDTVLPPAESRDFYRITLTGQGTFDCAGLKAAFSRIPNLELRDRTEAPLDIWGDESADTLEGTYFRLLRARLEEADPDTARQIRLAAELSRRLLEGREVPLP